MTPWELKHERLKLGYKSRRAFAEAVGVSTQTVVQWETAEGPWSRKIPPWVEVMLRCMREREKWRPKGL